MSISGFDWWAGHFPDEQEDSKTLAMRSFCSAGVLTDPDDPPDSDECLSDAMMNFMISGCDI